MHRLAHPRSLALVTIVGLPAVCLGQQAYYVRASGNDAANGLSPTNAFRTISKAMSVANAGSTVYIGAGTYPGTLTPSRSGTTTQPIRFIADIDGTQTGDAGVVLVTSAATSCLDLKSRNYIHLTGLTFEGATDTVSLENSNGIRLANCTIRGMSGTGITVKNTTGLGSVLIEQCTITGGTGAGIVINQNATVTLQDSVFVNLKGDAIRLAWPNSSLLLTRCSVESTTGLALDIDRGAATVTNFLARDCAAGGIRVGTHSSVNVRIVNATIAPGSGIAINQAGGILALHNSIIAQATDSLRRASGTTSHDYNLYFQCVNPYVGITAAAQDLQADPMFTSSTNLRPDVGSPAIDSGADMSAFTTTDLDRKTRPINKLFDRGCYEFGTAPSLRIIKWEETSPD